jgi:hypothetical protein
MAAPTFNQLKKTFLDSGFEIRLVPRRQLEGLALDAPYEVKRHLDTNIMGLIMPDEYTIALAKELDTDDRAVTLLHELIHLHDENLPEEEVEALTGEMEQTLTPAQFGFLQFLVA